MLVHLESQLVAVEVMYDSSRNMVSSTWFSAESNLKGGKNNSESINTNRPKRWFNNATCTKGNCAPTYWCEVVRLPVVAFQEQWSSPQPQSAVQAQPRWPAEMPEWPRFAGISPADACRSSRKPIHNWSVTTFKFERVKLSCLQGQRDIDDMGIYSYWTHLLSLLSNRRRSMRLATVCTKKNVHRQNQHERQKACH